MDDEIDICEEDDEVDLWAADDDVDVEDLCEVDEVEVDFVDE